MEEKDLKIRVNELMVNQHHMLEAIKYLHEKVEEFTEKANSENSNVKDSQAMIDAIIVKNSDDIKLLKKTREENNVALKVLDTKIDKINDDLEKTKNNIKEMSDKTRNKVNVERPVYTMTCNSCDESFHKSADLENHIKECHENHPLYKCENCKKVFVLKWRLNKHMNLHSKEKFHPVNHCHYFNNDKKCPFEELGCKFLHSVSQICKFGPTCEKRMCSFRHTKQKKDKVTNIENVEVSEEVENDELADDSNFMTSTPIKGKFDCEECHNISQCTDCYVRQHMETGELATDKKKTV